VGELLTLYRAERARQPWRLVTDAVMGGISEATLAVDTVHERDCLRLAGRVRTENNGGFVQAVLELDPQARFDASAYAGIEMELLGNGETYNLHLRTSDLWMPWQAYRAGFDTDGGWQKLRIPFSAFRPHRVVRPLDLRRLRRLGLIAIGRPFRAELCLSRLALYTD
jgi:hypothetical protein